MDNSKEISIDVKRRLIDAGYNGKEFNLPELKLKTHGKVEPRQSGGYPAISIVTGKRYMGKHPVDALAELWIAESSSRKNS